MEHEADALQASAAEELPAAARAGDSPDQTFRHRYTTGPFQLPPNAGSLDWIVMNNDVAAQDVRVTVYRGGIGTQKTPAVPGALTITVGPGESTHNANTYPTGYIYEIQVETNSTQVFPYASVWPGNFGEAIPGTAITSAGFVCEMPTGRRTSTRSSRLVAGRTPRVVTDAWYGESFAASFGATPVVLSSIESYWGTNPAATRLTDVTTDGFKVRAEEEQSLDPETAHLPEVVGYVAAEPGLVHDELGNVIGEVGRLTIAQSDGEQWHTVTLSEEICSPIVIAQVMTQHGADPCHVRVRNVTTVSFELQIEEWDYLTGHHVAEEVGFLVLEARHHRPSSGQLIEAGRCEVDHAWTTVALETGDATAPVVMSMCQTRNGPQAVVARQRSVSPTGFEVRLQEEEANDGIHTTETVGFVAISQPEPHHIRDDR